VACREGRAGPPRGGKTEKQPGDIINSLDSAAPSKRQQAYARKENHNQPEEHKIIQKQTGGTKKKHRIPGNLRVKIYRLSRARAVREKSVVP
jgi:hypothetical protein